jgi:tetratricopeptide (TPR) repeat protein
MARVFLSYDHEDASRAAPIISALEAAGHTVWWDRHIQGGAEFNNEIEAAVEECDLVIVLWSDRSIRSAWVRDEAAEGRDEAKLVPVLLDPVKPPMGFRQFQTIDLSTWKGRGKSPALVQLLDAVGRQPARVGSPRPARSPVSPAAARRTVASNTLLLAAAIVLSIGLIAAVTWTWLGRDRLPVVEVAASDSSAGSQAAASDLFVKLGSLAQVGEGKWQLVDAARAPSHPNLIFRTANTGSPAQPTANLVLLDGSDGALLWSREFAFPAGAEGDLRQQLSLTAARVLGCALESRDAGGLRRDLLKLFLNGCALLAEAGQNQQANISEGLRTVVDAQPHFAPAWSRLILLDIDAVDAAMFEFMEPKRARDALSADMAKVRAYVPDLPELTLAQTRLLAPNAFGETLRLVEKASAAAPDKPELLSAKMDALSRVGRQKEAVTAARRASELDPLSPATESQFIMALAYSGNIDTARKELARAERMWSGTGSIRQTLWGFSLRFGDPRIAEQYAPNGIVDWYRVYFAARENPSTANVKALVDYVHKNRAGVDPGAFSVAAQALGEFNQRDEFFAYVAGVPPMNAATLSYVLFRPGLKTIRSDPRFMLLAKRIGLVDYWRSSGHWPDFCSDDDIPYDCKAEAAKLSA